MIELVVVMGILIVLAGLLVPQFAGIIRGAGYATAAATSQDVFNNLELYKTTNGYYPQGMDSLLNSAGAIDSGVWSMGNYNTPGPLTNNMSWDQSFSLTYTVEDMDPALIEPIQGGTIPRPVDGSSSTNFAASNFALVATGSALAIAAGYSGAIPTTSVTAMGHTSTVPVVQLFAMGVGPNCAAVGQTMAQAPMCSTQTPDHYGRFIAVFGTYPDGTPAKLLAVVDSLGRGTTANIANFKSTTGSNTAGTNTTGQ